MFLSASLRWFILRNTMSPFAAARRQSNGMAGTLQQFSQSLVGLLLELSFSRTGDALDEIALHIAAWGLTTRLSAQPRASICTILTPDSDPMARQVQERQ
jgi:hypothetical protein